MERFSPEMRILMHIYTTKKDDYTKKKPQKGVK